MSKMIERGSSPSTLGTGFKKGEREMFSQLVESDLHRGELKRKGTFFLATMAA